MIMEQLIKARHEIATRKATVVCIDDRWNPKELTQGKEYTVLAIGNWMCGKTYRIVNDNGVEAEYYVFRFNDNGNNV